MPPLLRCLFVLLLNVAMVLELRTGRVTRRLFVTGVLTGCVFLGLFLSAVCSICKMAAYLSAGWLIEVLTCLT